MGNNRRAFFAFYPKIYDSTAKTLINDRDIPKSRKNMISLGILDSNNYGSKVGSGVFMKISRVSIYFKAAGLHVLLLCHHQT